MAKGARDASPRAPLTERRVREIAGLDRRRHRDRLGETVVEGERAVRAALAAGVDVRELVMSGSASDAPGATFDGRSAHVVPERTFRKLSHVRTPQGVLMTVTIRRSMATVEAARERTGVFAHDRLLVLDGVQDPGNVGALLRAAAWFGVAGVVFGAGTADPYAPRVIRASMGGVWVAEIAEADVVAAVLEGLKTAGVSLAAADLEGRTVQSWRPEGPTALVVGSEAHGISEGVRALAPERVTIPGHGDRRVVESLNAGAAAAVLLARWTGSV